MAHDFRITPTYPLRIHLAKWNNISPPQPRETPEIRKFPFKKKTPFGVRSDEVAIICPYPWDGYIYLHDLLISMLNVGKYNRTSILWDMLSFHCSGKTLKVPVLWICIQYTHHWDVHKAWCILTILGGGLSPVETDFSQIGSFPRGIGENSQ